MLWKTIICSKTTSTINFTNIVPSMSLLENGVYDFGLFFIHAGSGTSLDFILFCKYSSNAFVVYQLELSMWSLLHKENNLIKTKMRIALLRETISLCSMAYEAIMDLRNKNWTFHHCDVLGLSLATMDLKAGGRSLIFWKFEIMCISQSQWTSTNACPNLETSWSTYIWYMNLS